MQREVHINHKKEIVECYWYAIITWESRANLGCVSEMELYWFNVGSVALSYTPWPPTNFMSTATMLEF